MSIEINGFEVDVFNVFGIKSGAKISTCPICSEGRKKKTDKCMSVFWDTGLGQCNHCGERLQLHTYKKKENAKIYVKPIQKIKSDLSDVVVNWFKDIRGISLQTLIDLKITQNFKWMPKAKAKITVIEFNYFLFGELINIKSRGKNKDFTFEKECELVMYNIDAVLGQTECVLVEGEPDVLSFHESGVKNVCSVPNGFTLARPDGTSSINLNYLDDYIGLFDNMEKVYLAFDNDAAGLEGTKEFIRRLGAEKCYLVDFKDCKDANDYLLKYGLIALSETIKNAKIVPLEGILTLNNIEVDLDDFWINGAPRGKTVDLHDFDLNSSFVMKQHTLFVAAPNSGKSDFVDHLITRFAVKYGDKVGICSTENKPIHFHYDKLFRKIYGNRPTQVNIKNQDVADCKEFINSHFFHVDQDSRFYLEDILAKFVELVKRKGCRWFVIDPFNKVTLKSFPKTDINAYTAEYHQLIDAFQQKHDCHVFLVVHPVKMQLREGSTKTFKMPTAYDIKGGGEHFDMSYNIIGLVRDHERNVVNIRTLKWKFQHLGSSGHDSYLGWNINNGRYTNTENFMDETSTDEAVHEWRNENWLIPFAGSTIKKEPKETLQIPNATLLDAFGETYENESDVPF